MAAPRDGRTAPGTAIAVALILAILPIVSANAEPVDSTCTPANSTGLLAGAVFDAPTVLPAAAIAGIPPIESGFVLRRIPNPRYRSPAAAPPTLEIGRRDRVRALDFLHAQLVHHGTDASTSNAFWEVIAGEQVRGQSTIQLAVAGERRESTDRLRTLRLDAGGERLAGSLGDVPAILVPRVLAIHQMRGATLRLAPAEGPQWLVLGGGPTPIPGVATPRVGLGGLAVSDLQFDVAHLALSVVGFGRARPAGASSSTAGDTLAGRGLSGAFEWRAPAPIGVLGGGLTAQAHSLEGALGMAAMEAFEWNYHGPGLVASWRDERGSRTARIPGAQSLARAPRMEDRLQVQTRLLQGRGEGHLTGFLRAGGDPAMVARTIQIGLSGGPARSSFYLGADAAWDRRGGAAGEERRIEVRAGGASAGGHAALGRAQWSTAGLKDILTLDAETSLALRRGVRMTFAPRLTWDTHRLQRLAATSRVTWPLPRVASRMVAGASFESGAEGGFRGRLREASIALSWVPRPRDRSDLELRRIEDGGRTALEVAASYDAQLDRYEGQRDGWLAARDSGRVWVRVVRAGNGSGVGDVLVSLDGKELRFTDEEGVARFETVTPGVHVVAVEERSLPVHFQTVQASRAFVTVERGRATPLTTFEIARPVQRTSF